VITDREEVSMSEFVADPNGGRGSESGPPWVLIAALGAAAAIAVTVIGFLLGSGAGADAPAAPGGRPQAGAPAQAQRFRLAVAFHGSGTGTVRLAPGAISCSESCTHDFATGTRVTATAKADDGSTFDGWSDACDGIDDCAFVMYDPHSLAVTFTLAPADARCADPVVAAETLACADGAAGAPVNRAGPRPDCSDGIDNDGDGLIDSAQDPGCDTGGTEADPGDAPAAPAPAPAAAVPVAPSTGTTPGPASTTTAPAPDECHDGKDNDGDGLIDAAQDPGCATGTHEAG
jgi:hypothetical protein